MTEQYIYQVARIRCRELDLLSRQDIDQLLSAKTFEECLRTLADKGFGTGTETSVDALLQAETEKLWALMQELLPDLSPFDVLLYPTDYNNLKAAIKGTFSESLNQVVYKAGGTVDPALMQQAVVQNDFSALPKALAEAGQKAYQILLKTDDGQRCDVSLDHDCLAAILAAAAVSEDTLVKRYAELTVAIANIKIAVRCQKTGKSATFINEALVPCESLRIKDLAAAATKSLDDVLSYLALSPYSGAVEPLKESNSAFEKWCDDTIMALVKTQKTNPFTIGPLLGFVLARQNEMAVVKIILSGKLNHLKDDMIQERLREMYV